MPHSRLAEKSFLNHALAERTARRFQVLSEPMRIRILGELAESAAVSAGQIADSLRAPVRQVGEQLEVLRAEGLVAGRSENSRTIYWLPDPKVVEVCKRVISPFQRTEGRAVSEV